MFKNSHNITSVALSSRLWSIGQSAFEGCTGLTALTIPTSDAGYSLTIGTDAFKGCTSLATLTAPMDYSYTNDSFSGCTGLTSIGFSGTTGPTLAAKNSNSPWYGAGTDLTLTIPATATVTAHMFEDCTKLKSLNLTSFTGTIEADAFKGCTGLENLKLGTPTSISSTAFNGLMGLSELTIPLSLTDDALFTGLDSLTIVYVTGSGIPGSYASTYTNTPWYVTSQSSASHVVTVSLDEDITAVSEAMFKGATKMASITLNKDVASIGANAFNGCTGLATIIILNTSGPTVSDVSAFDTGCASTKVGTNFHWENTSWGTSQNYPLWIGLVKEGETEGVYKISESSNVLVFEVVEIVQQIGPAVYYTMTGGSVEFYGSGTMYDLSNVGMIPAGADKDQIVSWWDSPQTITSVTIPVGIESVGAYMFKDMSSVNGIDIPPSVTVIGAHAFDGMSSLTYLDLQNVRSVGADAFDGCSSLVWIRLPYNATVGDTPFTDCDGAILYATGTNGTSASTVTYSVKVTNLKVVMLTGVEGSFVASGASACVAGTLFSSDASTLATSFASGKTYKAIAASAIESDDNRYTASATSTFSI